jgi:hypothetical protein
MTVRATINNKRGVYRTLRPAVGASPRVDNDILTDLEAEAFFPAGR